MQLRVVVSSIAVMTLAFAALFGLQTFRSAAATTYPVTAADADTNSDGLVNVGDLGNVVRNFGAPVGTAPRPVAEQNLDQNGNIKVREQGTINVAMQEAAGTTTTIFDGDVSPGQTFYTSFAEVEPCDTRMTLFADRSASVIFDNHLAFVPSPDGVTGYGVPSGQPPNLASLGGFESWYQIAGPTAYLDLRGYNLGPFMQFGIRNGITAQHVTVKLYCRG